MLGGVALSQALNLDDSMTKDKCKSRWLNACSSFFVSPTRPVTSVAKQISCDRVMCDQSPYYSNCVEDADCAAQSIANVNSGPPLPGTTWPLSAPWQDLLPAYKPCCNFWENYCNGPSCSGQEKVLTAVPVEYENLCPVVDAQANNFCDKPETTPYPPGSCWLAGSASALSTSMMMASVLSAAALALGGGSTW